MADMAVIAIFLYFCAMKKIGYWIEAMRLRTLPVSVAGVLMALGYNVDNGTFKFLPAAICLVFAILCQIASNFANEYYDYRAGRDRRGRQGPRRGVTEGEITPHAMKTATFGVLAAAALLGLSLTLWGGPWLIAAGIAIGLGALAYSAGPYPLSTHCLGEVAVFFFFGIIPVNLTYYVQALDWSHPVFLGSCAIGLMGANVLIINNYRDIPDDCSAGKNTLATAWGPKAMRILYCVNALLAVIFTMHVWYVLPAGWYVVPVAYLIASLCISREMRRRSGATLTPLLGMTSVCMFAYALCFLIATYTWRSLLIW